ncbi:MAG: putative bifunctional diguanylate cyclase/phosphodiesterase [Acidimicrobiales bacterium]
MVLASVLLASAFFGGWSIWIALEDREAAAAARDLQVAASRVAAADAVRIAGGDPIEPGLDLAVESLSGDHTAALSALSPSDAASARALLVGLAGCGSWLLDPGDATHEVHGHSELQNLLDAAAISASAKAVSAEREAALALLGGLVASAIGVSMVVGSRVRAHRQRSAVVSEEQAGRRLAALVHDSPDMFLVIDPNGLISYRSASSNRLIPLAATSRDDVVALASDEVADHLREHLTCSTAGGDSDVFDLIDTGGVKGRFELRVSDLTHDPAVAGHLVTARDVTTEHRLQNELRSQAKTDVLTGVANRRGLSTCLEAAKQSLMVSRSLAVFVIVDIDSFKEINDSFGHDTGDELLRLAASRLRGALEPTAALLRLGSDEFAAIAANMHTEQEALTCADALRAVFAEPFRVSGRTERLSARIGVAVTAEPEEIDSLHRRAEIALQAAKNGNGDRVVIYQPALEHSIARTTRIRRALYTAVYDDEFSVVYQPIVSADSAAIVGLEALLRWDSPTIGIVGPDEFIPIAEAAGDICPIGRWVVENVCRQLSSWSAGGMPPDLTVSFNVSARQLAEAEFVRCVTSTANAWEIDPQRLVVEVTETTALDRNGIAIGRLNELRAAGFRISIDDFGSGYSNLGQLLRVPFDVLKIDRSLLLMLTEMRELAGGDANDSCQITAAIVSIAEILGVPVVCEGVETEEQRRSLAASGITYLQGYLTGRPATADDTGRLLELAATSSPLSRT